MSILIIVSHPLPNSFNHAIANHLAQSLSQADVTIHLHDLYAEKFQPVLQAADLRRKFSFDNIFAQYSNEIRNAQGFVFVYPDWWGMPPAILKGWIDRLLCAGIAFQYEGSENMDNTSYKTHKPLLTGKRAIVVCTTNEPQPDVNIEALWRKRIFNYVGIQDITFETLCAVRASSLKQRQQWLQHLADKARICLLQSSDTAP